MKKTQIIGKSKGKNKTKMKVYNSREMEKILRKNGWYLARKGKSDHMIYKHPEDNRYFILPKKKLNRIIMERCVNEFGLALNV